MEMMNKAQIEKRLAYILRIAFLALLLIYVVLLALYFPGWEHIIFTILVGFTAGAAGGLVGQLHEELGSIVDIAIAVGGIMLLLDAHDSHWTSGVGWQTIAGVFVAAAATKAILNVCFSNREKPGNPQNGR